MMHAKNLFIVIGLACLFPLQMLVAQGPQKTWNLRAEAMHQYWIGDFGIGTLAVYDEVNIRPLFRVGLERSIELKDRMRVYRDVSIGYHQNTYEEHSLILGLGTGVEVRIWKQLRFAKIGGLNINFAKPADVRYVYDGEKWVKAKNTDPVVLRLQIPVGLQLGWRFGAAAAHPIDFFVNGAVSIIGPWQRGSGIPVLFTKSAGAGLRIAL